VSCVEQEEAQLQLRGPHDHDQFGNFVHLCLHFVHWCLCTLKMIDDEVADARIKNECSDSDCFEQKSDIETKFTKSTKSSAPLRMGFARIKSVNAVIAVISVVLLLVFI
jgi:hypothetical protein